VYDPGTAFLMMVYSSAAYCPPPLVTAWKFLNPACVDQTTGFELTKVRGHSPCKDTCRRRL
jgi:hypothetical protein